MEEAKWYVAHTYSGYENKVKADIEKTIQNRNLEDTILEVSVPTMEVVEVKNGQKKVVEKKLFPGYVLVRMIMNEDTWYIVRNTRGVTGFVGMKASDPTPLTDEEVRNLGMGPKKRNVVVDYQVGDEVIVYGNVVLYGSSAPVYETSQGNAYLYSLNGVTGSTTPA